jgi:hypothetical protein
MAHLLITSSILAQQALLNYCNGAALTVVTWAAVTKSLFLKVMSAKHFATLTLDCASSEEVELAKQCLAGTPAASVAKDTLFYIKHRGVKDADLVSFLWGFAPVLNMNMIVLHKENALKGLYCAMAKDSEDLMVKLNIFNDIAACCGTASSLLFSLIRTKHVQPYETLYPIVTRERAIMLTGGGKDGPHLLSRLAKHERAPFFDLSFTYADDPTQLLYLEFNEEEECWQPPSDAVAVVTPDAPEDKSVAAEAK